MPITSEERTTVLSLLRRVTDALARRDETALHPILASSRCGFADLCRVMDESGGAFAPAPDGAYDGIDIAPIHGEARRFGVDADLWTSEGQASDLSVILTIDLGLAQPIEIDDLRVM